MILFLLAAPLAFLVGVSLGLLGGGGSILTVPILVYVLHLEPKSAIATSLVVVGITALVGAIRHGRHGNLDVKLGSAFGVAGIAGASVGSRVAALSFLSGGLLLSAFAVLMLVVATLMLRDTPRKESSGVPPTRVGRVAVAGYGLLTGLLTGLLGVGGGFVIVPVLLVVARLPIHVAVGTSLLVIALNCAAGLVGLVGAVPIHWTLALVFALASVLGSWWGASWSRRVAPRPLRRGFAVFILVAGAAILVERGLLARMG